MKKKFKALQEFFGENRIRIKEPLELHTIAKVKNLAQFYIEVQTVDEIIKGIRIAHNLQFPYLVFGSGSNLAIDDKIFPGLVIKNNCRRFDIMSMIGKMKNKEGWKMDVNQASVFAEGGVIMNQLVRFTIEHGLGGLENQLGLPGTVGGAIYFNSHHEPKKSSVGDFLYNAKLLTKEGEVKEVDQSYFKFVYGKSSVLKDTQEILLSAVFKLTPQDKKVLWEKATEALKYRNSTK